MDISRSFRTLENYKVPDDAVALAVNFEAPNEVRPFQLVKQRNDAYRFRRKDPQPEANRLPFEDATIIALVPQSNEQQPRIPRDRYHRFIGPEAWMDAADARH